EDQAGGALLQPQRRDPPVRASDAGERPFQHRIVFAHRVPDRAAGTACHCFSAGPLPIRAFMIRILGRSQGSAATMNENKGGPWGPSGGGGGEGGGDGGGDDGSGGPRSPWGQPPRRRRPTGVAPNIGSIDDFLKKSRERFGGR